MQGCRPKDAYRCRPPGEKDRRKVRRHHPGGLALSLFKRWRSSTEKSQRREPVDLIIIGLGNQGPEYENTRHNVGFWAVDLLAERHNVRLSAKHNTCFFGEGEIEGKPVVLAKPRTFMNLSGQAAKYLQTRYATTPEQALIICDDMDLSVGNLRLRTKGSAGGHNGLKSVIHELGSQNFARLRIGIGRPRGFTGDIDYVLSAMSSEERSSVDEAVNRTVDAVSAILTNSIDRAMNTYNSRSE